MKNDVTTGGCDLPNYNPVKSIQDDILYRNELVKVVSDLIVNADASQSYTMGICGKWGSGKTSFINFIKEEIGSKVEIVDFNPWIYDSQNEITIQFLELLSYHLSSRIRKWYHCHRRGLTKVIDSTFKIIPDPCTSKLIESFSRLLVDNNGIPIDALKSSIALKMKKRDRKIIVFIDDIDRLDDEEIRRVMKLVRSVADFPNIVYVLCYDSDIVAHALSTNCYEGHLYLQKIINLSISLPEYSGIAINLLTEQYQKITRRQTLNDYETSILCQFNDLSLREVNLIMTGFSLLFEVSQNNTCPIDLLALEYIRTKSPDTMAWIVDNRSKLCGMYLPPISDILSQKKTTVYDYYPDELKGTKLVELLSIMFPLFKGDSNYDDSKEQYRINDSHYIDNYFQLTPSSLSINDEEVERLFNCSPDDFYNHVFSKDFNYAIEMIRRIYMKVENHPDAERNCRLIDLCLTQPFHGDKYIKGGFSRHISRLVGICLQSIPITDDVVEYLETKCPDEIHRLISYGLIIDILISSEISNIEKRPLYDLISGRLYQNPDLNKITAPAESLFLVVLIHRTNSEHAKATFTELFPTLDKRKKLYADLTDQRYEVSFLKKLAGDP